jgi:hypothetical protein
MMKAYYGSKLVTATPMTRLAYNELRGWDLPTNENGEDDGYLVEDNGGACTPNHPNYGGYISWTPKVQFDSSYREIERMTFGLAIEALKRGASVSRKGWNGKGMYVTLVPESEQLNSYLAIKNVNGSTSTWVPSINDTLSEDWAIL